MTIIGRIFDILVLDEKSVQVVLKKKLGNKVVPIAFNLFGYWKDKAIKDMKLKRKDKIKANVYMKSRLWKGKYLTDVYFREIFLIEPSKEKPIDEGLFSEGIGNIYDENGKPRL